MTDDIDHRLGGLKDTDAAPPAFSAVLQRRPRRLRRGVIAVAAALAVVGGSAEWWSQQQRLDGGQYALTDVPSTDWLLEAPDGGVDLTAGAP